MSYWLHPEAEIEFTDAALYYAEHASNIIANAFIRATYHKDYSPICHAKTPENARLFLWKIRL